MPALIVQILGDTSKLGASLDEAGGKAEGFAASLAGPALALGGIAVAGIGAVKVIGDLTSAAAEDEAGQLRLSEAIASAGAATGDYNLLVDEAIKKGQARAFTDDQSRDALVTLVGATGDVGAATDLLAKSQDIARLAGVDLATASDAVAKAAAGQDTALTRMLPGLEKGATGADTLAAATKLAAGQADTYAESAAGMQEAGADAFSEIGETIGSAFLPFMKEVLPALMPVISALGELITAILPVIIPLLTTLGKVIGIVASALVTVVHWLTQLVTWLGNAMAKIGDFLAAINPLKNISLPSLPSLPFAAAASAGGGPGVAAYGAGVGASGVGAITVNVYTQGDSIAAEQAVVRALRRVTRINGGVVPGLGWSGG